MSDIEQLFLSINIKTIQYNRHLLEPKPTGALGTEIRFAVAYFHQIRPMPHEGGFQRFQTILMLSANLLLQNTPDRERFIRFRLDE